MKNIFKCILLFSFFVNSQDIKISSDTIVKTFHETTIKNEKINYVAETGTQPVWDDDGNIIASLFYTYYKRSFKESSKNNSINDR
ncbi:MAG: hypothetical protein CM15mP22_1440 [Gammaproteobacteria bacterium]|nr:MAG: hypothetical protein CM15mP22_1440 [Gammaproteobacteria bacterium]